MDILLYEPKYYNDIWNLIEYYKNGDTEILQFPKSFLNQEKGLKNLLDHTYYNLRKLIFIIDNFKDNEDIQIPTKFMVFYNFYQDYINGNIEDYNFYYIKDKFALSSFNKNNMKAIDTAFQDSTGAIINPTDYNKQQLFYCLLNTELDLNNPQSCIDILNDLLENNGDNITIFTAPIASVIPVLSVDNNVYKIVYNKNSNKVFTLITNPNNYYFIPQLYYSIDYNNWIQIFPFEDNTKIKDIIPFYNGIIIIPNTIQNYVFVYLEDDQGTYNTAYIFSDIINNGGYYAGSLVNFELNKFILYMYNNSNTNQYSFTFNNPLSLGPDSFPTYTTTTLGNIYYLIVGVASNISNKATALFNSNNNRLTLKDINFANNITNIYYAPPNFATSYNMYTHTTAWQNITYNLDYSKIYFSYKDHTADILYLIELDLTTGISNILYSQPSNAEYISALAFHTDGYLYVGFANNLDLSFARYNFQTKQLESLDNLDPTIPTRDITNIISLPNGNLLFSTESQIFLGTP